MYDTRPFHFAAARKPKPVRLPIDIARRQGAAALTKLMAEEMIEQVAAKGDCTIDNLRAAGFTASEITELHYEARQLAARRFVREVA